MRLGLKIILPILLLLVVILGAFGYLFYNLKQLEAIISAQTIKIQKLNSLNERLGRQQEQTDYSLLAYRFHPDRSFLLAISQAELDKSKTLDDMFPFFTTSRGRELVNSYIGTRREVESLRNDLVKAIDSGDKKRIDTAYTRWSIQTQNIKAALADIGTYNINLLEKTLVSVEAARSKITQIIIVLTSVVVATVILFYAYLRVAITIPLVNLAQFADEIAHKNFTTTTTTTTTGINSKDEIGMLARSFNTMSIKLKEYYGELEQKVTEKTAELSRKILDLENAKIAARNVLEDLQIEQGNLAQVIAKDEAILLSIGDGLIATDQNARVIFMNKAIERLVGWKKEEVMGKSWFEIIPMEDEKGNAIPDDQRPIQQAISLGITTTTTTTTSIYYFTRKNKTKFPVAVSATPIILNGKVIGAIGVYRDITHDREVDKAKSEFISLASHQLRTPLGIAKWYLEAVEKDKYLVSAPKSFKNYLDEVYKSNERALVLVRDLLSVSRIDNQTLTNIPQATDIVVLLKHVVKDMNIMAIKNSITIHLNLPKSKLPTILIDPVKIHEVLENLIANAVEYSNTGGIIEIYADKNKDAILITVKDTGIGIPAKDQKKIFTKFFRSENGQVKNAEGSGLGLYVVKSYVEEWGGKIAVQSTLGKGSSFSVTIPFIINTPKK